MPRRRRIILVTLFLSVAAAGAWVFLRLVTVPFIRETHTQFLFLQLRDFYGDSLAKGKAPVRSDREFLALVPGWRIDWNSCKYRDGTIIDAWGTPAQVRVDPAKILLRSAGPDRRFDTGDDLRVDVANSAAPP